MQKLFGTDGIRGPVGTSPLTAPELMRLGNSIGQWLTLTYGPQSHIIIAQDTRNSGQWITSALSAGLLLSPLTIHQAGVLPTPAVSRLIAQDEQFSGGIIVSASHNAYHDNGIKLVNHLGKKLESGAENSLTYGYHAHSTATYQHFGSTRSFANASEQYQKSVIHFFSNLDLTGHTIVLDCAHGATYRVAPAIFRQLGAEVIELNSKPTGTNINAQCGSVHPQHLQKAMRTHTADIGIAFDGDGDRAIVANHAGVIKNGDDIIALLSRHSAYCNQNTIVGTVMSNQGLAQYLAEHQQSFVRTPVGDKWVSDFLEKSHLLLGGEQSGHIILRDYSATGDGIVTALRLIEITQDTHNWDLKSFTPYPQLLINVPVRHKKDLKQLPIVSIITEYEQKVKPGRLSVRYSGTENVLRIMVEADQIDTVRIISEQLTKKLKKELQ